MPAGTNPQRHQEQFGIKIASATAVKSWAGTHSFHTSSCRGGASWRTMTSSLLQTSMVRGTDTHTLYSIYLSIYLLPSSILNLVLLDLTHLIKTEVPVIAAPNTDITDEEPIIEVEERQEAPKHREPRAVNPCHPNPCFNGGVCVESEGRASCRCVFAGLDLPLWILKVRHWYLMHCWLSLVALTSLSFFIILRYSRAKITKMWYQ